MGVIPPASSASANRLRFLGSTKEGKEGEEKKEGERGWRGVTAAPFSVSSSCRLSYRKYSAFSQA